MSTTASADGMLAAIERNGYYPGIVADSVSSAVGPEQVVVFRPPTRISTRAWRSMARDSTGIDPDQACL
jgi:hypothetical protein